VVQLIGGGDWAPAALIVDMDGVLYRGSAALAGLAEFVDVTGSWPRVLLTNNSTVSAPSCARKLRRLGVTVPEQEILTVSAAMTGYLAGEFAPGTSVYVIGERPLRDAVRAAGLTEDEPGHAAVVLGLDRNLRFDQLCQATSLLRAGRPLIVTSLDPVLLTADGAVPGTGAIAAALRACADVAPVCVGKPEPRFFQAAMRRLGMPADRVLVVGDSLTADIAGGQAAGARTALMLTGVTAAAPSETGPSETGPSDTGPSGTGPRPDYIFGSLRELTRFLRRCTG
jgi:HAD superfamily hydrolase (TIGR01450 family)